MWSFQVNNLDLIFVKISFIPYLPNQPRGALDFEIQDLPFSFQYPQIRFFISHLRSFSGSILIINQLANFGCKNGIKTE